VPTLPPETAPTSQPDSSPSPAPRWGRVALILNRESGTLARLGPDETAGRLQKIFEDAGIAVDLALVPGAEIEKTLLAARDGAAEALIIGGGDGSVAAAATVLAGGQKPLGILPLGTFNLAARDAGMPLDLEAAATSLLTAPVVATDLLDFDGQLFCCVMVLGFYPALALGRKSYTGPWIIRSLRTLYAVFRNAATFPPLKLMIQADGKATPFKTSMAVLVNNDFEDLFGLIPKRQALDGGYFTVYLSRHRTRWGLFLTFISWLFGRWRVDREMTALHASEITINAKRRRRLPVMRDGEVTKLSVPFTVKLRAKALPLLAPRALEPAAAAVGKLDLGQKHPE
jgi:diacylglycerol kinase family enzyme